MGETTEEIRRLRAELAEAVDLIARLRQELEKAHSRSDRDYEMR